MLERSKEPRVAFEKVDLATFDVSTANPNTIITGINDLTVVDDMAGSIAKGYDGDSLHAPSLYTQLTDSAGSLFAFPITFPKPPKVVYLGPQTGSDEWTIDGSVLRGARHSNLRLGFGELVVGVGFSVLQPYKYGPRRGLIHRTFVVGKGQSSGLVKCATSALDRDNGPAELASRVRIAGSAALYRVSQAGAPGLGKKRR